MQMTDDHSISVLLLQLEQDPNNVAGELWSRFIERLIRAADRYLRNLPRRMVDEEDIALSAFASFVKGAAEGRFQRLKNRDDLWQVLAMLAERKAIAAYRREHAEKRGGGLVRGESVFAKMLAESSAIAGIDQIGDPKPQVLDAITTTVREKLEGLGDDLLTKIAMLKLEGYTNAEIAAQQSIALRSVERKLQLIRDKWCE